MTSTAIVPVTKQTDVARPEDVTHGMTFRDMVVMGDELARTGFLPEHIRNGSQFAAIVLDGRERGMLPMRAVRSLQMVKGKCIESADSQLARFKADGGHAKFLRLDDTGAELWLRHPNGDEHTETWTIEDSKRAGLAGNMHGKFPRAMFRSRAITAGLKSLGWEGSVGTYDADEIDIAGETQEHAPPPPTVVVRDPKQLQAALAKEITLAYDALDVVGDVDRKSFTKRILGKAPETTADLQTLKETLAELVEVKLAQSATAAGIPEEAMASGKDGAL
jgi:hypothetical protein